MTIVAKVHERMIQGEKRIIIAVCDTNLLKKTLHSPARDGRPALTLDLKKYANFYRGEKVNQAQLDKMLEHARNVNIVGEESIKAAGAVLKIKLTDARIIGGVPHIQYYRI